jgi:hypothetical protein
LICPYDTRELPPEIIEHARSTHPEIVAPQGSRVSEAYEDPHAFCRRLDSRVERPEGDPTIVLEFDLADLRGMRRMVTAMAVDCGLPGSRADELALAVNEIASNAVVHGGMPADAGLGWCWGPWNLADPLAVRRRGDPERR